MRVASGRDRGQNRGKVLEALQECLTRNIVGLLMDGSAGLCQFGVGVRFAGEPSDRLAKPSRASGVQAAPPAGRLRSGLASIAGRAGVAGCPGHYALFRIVTVRMVSLELDVVTRQGKSVLNLDGITECHTFARRIFNNRQSTARTGGRFAPIEQTLRDALDGRSY